MKLARSPWRVKPYLLAGILMLAASGAHAQGVCKKKTAGYFELVLGAARPAPAPATGASPAAQAALNGAVGDAARGREIAANADKGNCLACHVIPALRDKPNHGDAAPPLGQAGARYSETQLRQIMIDAKAVFPGSIMPSYYKASGLTRVSAAYAGKTILSPQEIEDVVAFLKEQK